MSRWPRARTILYPAFFHGLSRLLISDAGGQANFGDGNNESPQRSVSLRRDLYCEPAWSIGPLATPQGAVPPTHKTFARPAIGIYALRDGKPGASRGEYDRLTMAIKLGLVPQPPIAR